MSNVIKIKLMKAGVDRITLVKSLSLVNQQALLDWACMIICTPCNGITRAASRASMKAKLISSRFDVLLRNLGCLKATYRKVTLRRRAGTAMIRSKEEIAMKLRREYLSTTV